MSLPNFSITVTGETPNDLRENLRRAVALVSGGNDEAVAATAEPSGKPRSRKAADPTAAPGAAPAAAPAPAAPAAPVAGAISQADVRKKLQAVVARFGNDKCSEILLKHGAPNLGAITADKYAAVIGDADAALAQTDPLG